MDISDRAHKYAMAFTEIIRHQVDFWGDVDGEGLLYDLLILALNEQKEDDDA